MGAKWMGPPGTLVLEATPAMLLHSLGGLWMDRTHLGSLRTAELAIPVGHPGVRTQSWPSQLVILEAAVCGVAGGGTGGLFHWESLVGHRSPRAGILGSHAGFAAPNAPWFRFQKRVSGKHPFRTLGNKMQAGSLWGTCTMISTLWLPLPPSPSPLSPLSHVSLGSHQKHPLWHFFAHLDCFLQINPFSALPHSFPRCLMISCCRECLLLSELPGNGTRKPREALPRSRARSHRDICRGKGSLFQQTAGVQRHKHTQTNRPTRPEHLKRAHMGRCFSGPGWSHSESPKCRGMHRFPLPCSHSKRK
ncbi:uncharacterized protein LOC109146393 [Corvus cornix cornix]|nr:uncharacterized protein LOC109146393 [Corvus cornix cornix]